MSALREGRRPRSARFKSLKTYTRKTKHPKDPR